jgi:hypothetical protein
MLIFSSQLPIYASHATKKTSQGDAPYHSLIVIRMTRHGVVQATLYPITQHLFPRHPQKYHHRRTTFAVLSAQTVELSATITQMQQR